MKKIIVKDSVLTFLDKKKGKRGYFYSLRIKGKSVEENGSSLDVTIQTVLDVNQNIDKVLRKFEVEGHPKPIEIEIGKTNSVKFLNGLKKDYIMAEYNFEYDYIRLNPRYFAELYKLDIKFDEVLSLVDLANRK